MVSSRTGSLHHQTNPAPRRHCDRPRWSILTCDAQPDAGWTGVRRRTPKVSVFVTDGEQRATLALVRALGRAGIPATVGRSHAKSLSGFFRVINSGVGCPFAWL